MWNGIQIRSCFCLLDYLHHDMGVFLNEIGLKFDRKDVGEH